MNKRVITISLGGSLIIPDKINTKFLKEFKKILLKNSKRFKFVVICGGGSIARTYISGLRKAKAPIHIQGLIGIAATKMNAKFMSYLFKKDEKTKIPNSIGEIKKQLKNQSIVFSGALEFRTKSTTDSNAAEIAAYFKSIFINLTNIKGLYDKNPKKYPTAKFIPKISWEDFHKKAKKIKFKPGQHFVLDQKASSIIMKNKTKTYILGGNPKELDNLLNKRSFIGTEISG